MTNQHRNFSWKFGAFLKSRFNKFMNQISKPHIVDLLRIFDKNRMISPRIRYASVRSKPELLKDLAHHFDTDQKGHRIYLKPRQKHFRGVPSILYDLTEKQYYFDGRPVNVPEESRARPVFQIRKGPITVTFPGFGPRSLSK